MCGSSHSFNIERGGIVLKRLNLGSELEAKLAKLGAGSGRLEKKAPPVYLSTGIPEVDKLAGGIPRGAITLVLGPPSSGRTTLMHSTLAEASSAGEVCALVDATDAFHPASAQGAGVDLDRLLWVRCGGNVAHAITAAEMILQSGGFGLVVLDLADIVGRKQSLIPDPAWFRYRRAVENTPTALLVVGSQTLSASCAMLVLEMEPGKPRWAGREGAPPIASPLLGLEITIRKRKPLPAGKSEKITASLAHDIPE
jgi:hypothetical protein